jgi:hypothetical protein
VRAKRAAELLGGTGLFAELHETTRLRLGERAVDRSYRKGQQAAGSSHTGLCRPSDRLDVRGPTDAGRTGGDDGALISGWAWSDRA